MKKNYQKTTATAGTSGELVLPEAVTVTMAEIGAAVKEGLLALAVATGLQVMTAMMEESVTALAGPRGRHQPDRTAVRHGTEGRLGCVGRSAGPGTPSPCPHRGWGPGATGRAYEVFSDTEMLGDLALQRMMAKLSTRRYPAGLEPVGSSVEATARSTSKSAVSRRFVARTETALAELMAADLSGLDIVAVMIDGVHFAGHLCVVALGIGIDGTKQPARAG